jgi:signal transduction histidine kinase/DNA-binding response OmpR family regulator
VKACITILLVSALCTGSAQIPFPGRDKVEPLKNRIRATEGLTRANTLYELAKVYTTFNIDSAKLFVDQALATCRMLNDDTTFILIATGMQYSLGRVGEKDLARKYLISARNLKSPEAMIPKFQNLINVGLYFIHYWNYTQYDSSVYYGMKTIDLAENAISRADRSILVGAAYNKMGDNIKALEYYKTAETILNELPFYPGEYCYLYNQMGTLYADEGDLKTSEKFYLQSIALGKKAGGFPQVSPLTNLAVVYDRMGDYAKALKYLDSTHVLLPTETDPWRTAINIRNKGRVLTHAGKLKEGMVETLHAMEIYTRLKDNYTVARLHLQLSEAYRLLGDFKKAEHEALLALEWDRTYGYGELVRDSYRELARIYTATRQFGKAFEYQNRYLEILDSLNSAERRNKFVQLEKNFEFATQEKLRHQLERENELYLAQAEAERKVRIYLILGTIMLAGAVIIALVAYRRMRSQNVVLNQQNKKIEDQSQQLLEAAKTKSRFFANVSHELRTPVTLLNGMLELMRENVPGNNGGKSNGTSKKLDIALASSRRLQGMLNEVLDLSRVEAGELKLSRKRKELFPLLNRIVHAFESLAVRKRITLEFDAIAVAGLTIDIDEDKFEKVINNLMHNAIKFNRDGGWIRVTANRTETTVQIHVADSGVGIAEKDLAFVFDRFYQTASTDKLSSQGIGIGLSLVREFTELHGGDVKVSSQVNEGSCFTVELPIGSSDPNSDWSAIAETAEEVAELPEVNFKSFARRPQILIVEDNDEMRFYLKEILGEHVSIAEARHGVEGLTWLQTNMPDLIISDVMMPQMDGPEFLTHLKRSAAYRGIPVVMLTARASEEDLLHGLSLGVDDYIIKPFNARELKIRIHNLITNQEIRREWKQKPAEADELPLSAGPAEDELFMGKVRVFVEEHADNTAFGIGDLCDHLAMSERQLYRKAATLTGMTPAQLIKEVRMKIAYRLLLERKVTKVADLAKRVGFENSSYFSRQFEERFGRRPAEMI